MLTQPARDDQPRSTDLYPAGQPPGLMVCVGDGDPTHVGRVRSQLPAETFLFWLFMPNGADPGRRLAESRPAGERTLFCPLRADALYLEKVQVLCSVMPRKDVRLVVAAGQGARCPNEVRALQKAIRVALDNREQIRNRGLIRLRCSLENLPSIIRNRSLCLNRVPAGTSAIVCGAGPSLARQFGLLREAGRAALIIAVGHAVPSLVRAGIIPHVVVEVDAHAGRNWPPELSSDSLLVACTEVAPEVARRFKRVLWCYGSSPPFNQILKHWGLPLCQLQLAKTVSTCAVDLAVRMGCGRIALVGQDFCLLPGGQSHVDGAVWDNGDPIVPVPGNEGGTVPSTESLVVIREALEDYLACLSAEPTAPRPALAIRNCTHGGAAVKHTVRDTLKNFCAHGTPLPADLQVVGTGALPAWSDSVLAGAAAALETYRALAAAIPPCCRRLRRELERYPIRMPAVRKLQQQLSELVAREGTTRAHSDTALLINPLIQCADVVMEQTPQSRPEDRPGTDPFLQIDFLRNRFGFIADLCDDLAGDLERAGRLPAAEPGGPYEPGRPYVFRGFRRLGLATLARRNAELAAWLERRAPAESDARFQIKWMNQCVPHVALRTSDGQSLPLSSFVSMHQAARRYVDRLAARTAFDPAADAAVFIAPVNWTQLLAFAERYPRAELLVVEPWPELLAQLIERGAFLHRMPDAMTVAGVADGLRWEQTCRNVLRAWGRAGRNVLLLPHPRAGGLPEVRACVARLAHMAGLERSPGSSLTVWTPSTSTAAGAASRPVALAVTSGLQTPAPSRRR